MDTRYKQTFKKHAYLKSLILSFAKHLLKCVAATILAYI